jgi:tripartite-type tricarboxylate transporter receptor subunit TctC
VLSVKKSTVMISRTRAALALAFAAVSAGAAAQDYPARSVRMIVPFAAGGGSDLHARMLATALGKIWKHSPVIENMGGAGGGVGAANVAKSAPDGYTIFFVTHPILAINPALYKSLPYDPEKDFAPVVKLGETANILTVNAASGPKSVPELIKRAKDRPGTLNFGTGGAGTTQHLSAELFKRMANIDIVHVPFKGGALATAALMGGGDVQLQFNSAYAAMQAIETGKLRGLAVTSKKRVPMLPDMPAMSEFLEGYEAVLGYGIVVPAGTPAQIVSTLNRDINQVLAQPAYKAEMEKRVVYLDGGTPEQFRSWLADERKKWGELIRRLGLSIG